MRETGVEEGVHERTARSLRAFACGAPKPVFLLFAFVVVLLLYTPSRGLVWGRVVWMKGGWRPRKVAGNYFTEKLCFVVGVGSPGRGFQGAVE